MSMIQIVTDSTAYIDREFLEKHNIKMVPLSVNFEGKVENEGFPGEFAGFFDRLSSSTDFPTTSQPSVGAFAKIFEEAIQHNREVIAITISAKLSGTFNSASTAAGLVNPSKISVIDSETAAANLRALVEMAVELASQGFSRQEIVNQLEAQKKRMGIRLTVGTLEYLKKGGRLSSTGALIGSLLNIRPIIGLNEGKLEAIGKARGKKKALEKMIEDIPANASQIRICHIFTLDEATELKEMLQNEFPGAKITIEELGPVIGSHLGPKAMGVCYKY